MQICWCWELWSLWMSDCQERSRDSLAAPLGERIWECHLFLTRCIWTGNFIFVSKVFTIGVIKSRIVLIPSNPNRSSPPIVTSNVFPLFFTVTGKLSMFVPNGFFVPKSSLIFEKRNSSNLNQEWVYMFVLQRISKHSLVLSDNNRLVSLLESPRINTLKTSSRNF